MDLQISDLPREKAVQGIADSSTRISRKLTFLRIESAPGSGKRAFSLRYNFVDARAGYVRVLIGDHSRETEVMFDEVVLHDDWGGAKHEYIFRTGEAESRVPVSVDA